MRWFLPLLLILTTAAHAGSTRAPGGVQFEQGSFCAMEPVGEEVAEDTVSGTLSLMARTPEFYVKSPTVVGEIGVGFGILLEVADDFAGPATVTTTHPPMGPNAVTSQSWQTTYTQGDLAYNGFSFEFDYEQVFGTWTISAQTADGREIYHAEFNVLNPKFAPPPPCGGAALS